MIVPPWSREDCLRYVKRLAKEDLPIPQPVLEFILARLANCRDPEGNMLRMLNEVRGAKGSWNQRHDPDRPTLIPVRLLRQVHASVDGSRRCEVCGDTFRPARSTARYCGSTCRKRAQRAAKPQLPQAA